MSYDPNQARDDHGRWESGSDHREFYEKSLKQPLDIKEIDAFVEYAIASDNQGINHGLRTSNPSSSDLDVIKRFDSAFSKASIPKSMDVYRLVDPDFVKFIMSRDEFKDLGYSSTSTDPDIAKVIFSPSAGRDNTFKIHLPEKFPAIPMPYHIIMSDGIDADLVHEKEVLLNRGSIFIKTGPMEFKASR